MAFVKFLYLLLVPVMAWHTASPKETVWKNRRTFLVQTPLVAAALTTSLSASALTPETAASQWQEAVQTIDKLLDDWDTVAKGGGDAIRTQLGTQGITSPLFQVDKALKLLREEAEDLIEFTELSNEFSLALSRADSMAYSANFAGGSGKPTPPAVYIEKSRKEVMELQSIAKSLSSQL